MMNKDNGVGNDAVGISQKRALLEKAFEKAKWGIARYANDADKKVKKIYSDVEAINLFGVKQFSKIDGNCLCNQGINEFMKLGCGTGGAQFNNADAVLIVGTGSSAAQATDTEATFTAGVKKAMEIGFPTYGTDQKAIWKSSFGSAEANQAWNEFGVSNNATTGDLLNRKVSSQGTKTSGQTWELTLQIALS